MIWGKSRNIIAALEVGSTKITVGVAEVRPDGQLNVLGCVESPSEQVRKCEIIDFHVAQDNVRQALALAENQTDVVIGEVYLALSGSHVRSSNIRVTTEVNSEGGQIEEDHLKELHEMVLQQPLPADHAILHQLRQHYVLDSGHPRDNPVGLSTRYLTAHYHQISGLISPLQTTIRCVKELSIDVKNCALSSYATAQAVLTDSQKKLGAVVINLGGGVTDYIAYQNGSVVHSGVLGVGAEHLTSDLMFGLSVSYAKAELLKKTEGSVILDPAERESTLNLPGSYHEKDRVIYRESLNTILQVRQAEILEIIFDDLQNAEFWNGFYGTIHFTGGGSHMRGLVDLASQIFKCDVRLAQMVPFDGDQRDFRRPELATVLGLLRYAEKMEHLMAQDRGLFKIGRSLKKALSQIRAI